jgi:hypothetical protein
MAKVDLKDVVFSLVGLTTTNGGMFKSEKQAKFLKSFFMGDTLQVTVPYTFGEFGGCTRLVGYVIKADDTSITFISKQGKVIWTTEQKQQAIDKYQKKQQERRSANEQQLLELRAELEKQKAILQADVLRYTLGLTAAGIVKDVVEVTVKCMTGKESRQVEDLVQEIARVESLFK